MPALIGIPEMFNGISRRIITKTILSSGSFRASSHFLLGCFFYLGFRFWFGISVSILTLLFYFNFE
jgi:hypothetical protein